MLDSIAKNELSATYAEVSIRVPWGVIAGRWYGDQLQRPILALHGWRDNCGSFAKLAPLLAPQRSLLCIDLPGHGRSTHLPAGVIYDTMTFVRVIRRVMLIYKWPKISLLGHSMGAALSFIFAALYPQSVDMLISLDYIKLMHMPEDAEVSLINLATESAIKHNHSNVGYINEPPTYSYGEMIQLMYESSGKSIDLDNCAYILERNIKKSQKYPDKYYFTHDPRVKEMLVFNPNAGLTAEFVRRITNTKVPHLLLKGGATEDMNAHLNEVADILREKNPNFEQHVIANGRHHLHLNDADEVAAHIIRCLKQHQLLGVVPPQVKGNENVSQGSDKVKKSKL